MQKYFKLGAKFFFTLTFISILPLAIVIVWNYNYSKNKIISETIGILKAINDSRATHINSLIQLRQEQAKALAGTYIVRQLSETGVNPPEKTQAIQSHIESVFQELKAPSVSDYQDIDRESTVENISIWDNYGKIVANTNRKFIGRRMPDTILHILFEKGTYFIGFNKDPLTGQNFLTILEEVRNWNSRQYSGVILLKFNAKVLNDITTAREGLGETAETYIVDKELRMITESRFVRDAILKVPVKTQGTDACFKGGKAPYMYTDYQEREVLGVQKYLPDQNWCVVTEIGINEAFEPIETLRNQIFTISVVLIILILILVNWARGTFIRPVTLLRDASLKVARGNYNIQVDVKKSDEIGELAQAFNQMTKVLHDTTSKLKTQNQILEDQKNQLQRFDELKSEFVSTVSHELRTPMTIIKDSVTQLLEEEEDVSSEDRKMLLSMALGNINRLGNLINNLLDLSKIEAGKIELHKEMTNIVSLARETCLGFKTQARKKNLELKFVASKKEIMVNLDKDKITQVLINLIGNSFKFVNKGGIEVSVVEKDNKIICTVADTGRGISKEDLKKVFHKFQQVGGKQSTGIKGTGLGLSICKGLIDLHQGDIWVESELGKGTKFIFTLPKNI